MIHDGKRIRSNPLLIKNGEEPQFLKRTPTNEKLFKEEWLQELIFNHPALLPSTDIDPVFSPLISIGREISTNVGPIDNIFISPQGYLTIVETKLWRNPEARREVVGQIVDYAKVITKWSFNDLDRKVKNYFKSSQNRNTGIVDLIREHDVLEDGQESELIDTITRHMKQGEFLLLIVGDGIRESLEDMAEYLSQMPQLHFTLALVELKVYEMEEGRLVIPQLVMRTREVTRAVIRIEGAKIENLSIDMDLNSEKPSNRSRKLTLSEEQYFAELSKIISEEGLEFVRQMIDDTQDIGCEIQWKQSSFVIKYPDPLGSGRRLTLLVVTKKGELYVDWLHDQLKKTKIPVGLGETYRNDLRELLNGCAIDPGKPNVWSIEKSLSKYEHIISTIEKFIDDVNSAIV